MADQSSRDCSGVGPISQEVRKSLSAYFSDLNGDPCCDLYQMVMEQVELPMLEVVMRECNGNQTKAADALGINRGTLRKKLRQYGLEN
ncbi:MAG: DNA-binding transcriptional regulator Fis [Gammaproteobacteria bacterium]|nr:DNA-binding transcriptional regulator Fis [Gammaproteobacteria bacterium]